MPGLDPGIHAFAGTAGLCCVGVVPGSSPAMTASSGMRGYIRVALTPVSASSVPMQRW
jgi:hypothetical protein